MSTDLTTIQPARPAQLSPHTSASLSAGLAQRARDYIGNSKAANTQRAYRAHWKTFAAFCERHGVPALPASASTVGAFLTEQAETHRAATLSAKLAAIAYQHRAAHLANPCDAVEVKELMRGIRRTLGVAPRRKKAATLDLVQRMTTTCPDDLRGQRDRALLLVGFFGAFRRSELAAMRVEDVTVTDYGARVLVPKSKTDQEGEGRYKQLERLDDAGICPVTALRAWLQVAGITSGYVFRGVDLFTGKVNAQPISGRHIARIVKDAAAQIGETVHEFAGHSLRAGFVTSAKEAGADDGDVMEQTGHTTPKMILVYNRMQGQGARRAVRAMVK
jgi:integrase